MALIESKGNMYSWTTHQWNPVGGNCIHNCSYCYVGRWGEKPPLNFKEKYLKDDLGIGRVIFVVSGGDLFAMDVPTEWIELVLEHCVRFYNEYLFQSKNPQRFNDFKYNFPEKTTLCTTIETNRYYPQMGDAPYPKQRAMAMSELYAFQKFLTLEPIMDFDLKELIELVKLCDPSQINIGADSGNNNLPEPPKEKLLELIEELRKFTVIDQKRNLVRILGK